MQLNPLVKVTLLASNDPVDFDRQDIDIAIRWGNGYWPGSRVEKLGPDKLFPVCCPTLLREGPRMQQPSDLAAHTLLQTIRGSNWAAWFSAANVAGLTYNTPLHFDDPGLLLDAAVQCQGVALASALLVENDLRSGRLVRPFPLEIQTGEGFHVLTSPAFSDKPVVATFRRWIQVEADMCTS